MHKVLWLTALVFLGGGIAQVAGAQGQVADSPDVSEMAQIRAELDERIAEIKGNEEEHQRLMEEGRNRTVLCRTCHGLDGEAVKPGTPNLAGQNPSYIVDQFHRFADGRRYDFLMSNLAKTFDHEETVNIALYYSDLDGVSSGGGNPALMDQGQALYEERCASCHGDDGRGQEGYARLAGQQYDYLVKMLHEFKDRTGRRFNPWMSGVALKLNEEQIQAVSTYVSNLK